MDRTFHLFCLILSSSTFAQSGPVFHWRLDETSGNTAYATAGSSNGTLVGSVLWDANGGHHQGAARFDGVDDRIVLGSCDLTSGGQEISLSLWVKPDFVTGMERTLIAKTSGPQAGDHVWSIAFINATALRFRLRTGGTVTELSAPPSSLFGGAWYHIVATYDGSQMRLYVNASLMGSTPKTGSVDYAPQAPASIAATSTGAQAFSGWIDDVRIYDRALPDAEILDLLFETITTTVPETTVSLKNGSLHCTTDWQRMEIMDAMGRSLASYTRTTNTVDLPPLSAGIYLVCLQGHGTRTTTRLMVP
ncbi:MAG: T9SS type A sorting domain-containing protein [Flavobacteriales bacterium]|nr:T9SS type A sorting domain-containing protein [Flavobacteriales bacterium]